LTTIRQWSMKKRWLEYCPFFRGKITGGKARRLVILSVGIPGT
jgi:hypothetical protein